MKISAEEFLKISESKKRSKLEPFLKDILMLRDANLSHKKICEFLKLNGVETTPANVSWFIRSRHKSGMRGEKEPSIAARPTEAVQVASSGEPDKGLVPNAQGNDSSRFSWKAKPFDVKDHV